MFTKKKFLLLPIIAVSLLSAGLSAQTRQVNADSLFTEYMKIFTPSASLSPEVPSDSSISKPVNRHKCGLPLEMLMRSYYKNLSAENQALYKRMSARPEMQASVLSPSGRFRIHYDLTGPNTPGYIKGSTVEENVRQTGLLLDSVYNFEVVYLGYPAFPGDNGLGGDDACDVYLANLGGGYYGETLPDENGITTFIRVDNDFYDSQNTHGLPALKVTLAHEFHHVIQLTCYNPQSSYNDEYYLFESTATAMEEFVFDDVNDYYYYLPEYFNAPQRPFALYDMQNCYALVIWQLYLKERFGYDIIKTQWEYFRTNPALKSISMAIAQYSSSLRSELSTFGLWSCFTGYRKQYDSKNDYFSEGARYPLLKGFYNYTYNGQEKSYTLSGKAMSNYFLRFSSFNGTYTDTIIAIVTNADFNNAVVNPANDYKYVFTIGPSKSDLTDFISNNYYAGVTSENHDLYKSSFIFNGRTNPGIYYIRETEDPYPVPFIYARHEQLKLPVSYSGIGTADLYIYSPSMQLVYRGSSAITSPEDKFVLTWNGRDSDGNKLASGVYLYVTDSRGSLKKGKIVIINE